MAYFVEGDLYREIDGQLHEIKRQLRQNDGYPHNPQRLKLHLQDAIEGRFMGPLILRVDYSIKPIKFLSSKYSTCEIKSHPERNDVAVIDLRKVIRVNALEKGEDSISGVEALKRLQKTGKTPLDMRFLEELMKYEELIEFMPGSWERGRTHFLGTILCDSDGKLCAPCFYDASREGKRNWQWFTMDFGSEYFYYYDSDLIACLLP